MVYDIARELARQSYQEWKTHELFSSNWFLILAVNAVFYIAWIILLDKSRTSRLLLQGSLASVWYMIGDAVLFGSLGVAEYKVSIIPLEPPVFIVAVTIAPIIIMLCQQFAPSWKGYLIWSCIGMAFLAFALLPVYSLLGIFQLHDNWHNSYQFLFFISGALASRIVFLWFVRIDQKHSPDA